MTSSTRKSTTWRRVGVETQEAEGHRVHAQKDLVTNEWKFIAVRKGDGIRECMLLKECDTAKEARDVCEKDVHQFHWCAPNEVKWQAPLKLKGR